FMEYDVGMARSSLVVDSFLAIADPRRRSIVVLLAGGERPVNEVVESLGIAQSRVSKHLGVLKKAGVVSVRREGRQRVYRLNGDGLRPVHDWVKAFERFWEHQLDRIKAIAEAKAKEREHKS